LAFLSVTVLSLHAQLRIGIFGGIANYQGDLVDEMYQSPRPVVGVHAAYEINKRISLRAGLSFARVAGADSLSESDVLRHRNLDFQTNIYEFSLVGEINFLDMELKRWSPYAFGGAAVFRFDPFTRDQAGNRVYLQPLGTEGQGISGYANQYNRTQLAVPFGGGIKFAVSERLLLQAEVGLRKLFTDYLDDVSGNYADEADLLAIRGPVAVDISYRSDEVGGDTFYPPKGTQRGSPKYKDYYYFTGLHIFYRLGGATKKDRLGCPEVKL
ncbi:MAG TPA: DUF6089 family protein, partial [Flavisolibacter sp.]